MKEQSDNDTSKKFAQMFGDHVVGLQVNYRQIGGDDVERIAVDSGFILEHLDLWLWVTAGHFLRDIDDAISAKQIEVTGGQFLDIFGLAPCDTGGIPATYPHKATVYQCVLPESLVKPSRW